MRRVHQVSRRHPGITDTRAEEQRQRPCRTPLASIRTLGERLLTSPHRTGSLLFREDAKASIAIKAATAAALTFVFVGKTPATEWNVSVWGKRRAFAEEIEKLGELVSAKTDGAFTFTFNTSYGSLSKNHENLDEISVGAFEMAQFCAGYHTDKNPTFTALELPFLGVASLEEEVAVSKAIYAHQATQADLARWNAELLMPSPIPQYNINGVGAAPRTIEDYKGLTVRALGGIGKAMESIGAVPTSVTATEARQALDSGVVKSVSFAPHAHMAFGTGSGGNLVDRQTLSRHRELPRSRQQ